MEDVFMNPNNRRPNQFIAWMFSIGNWWDIICGNDFDTSDKLLKEILLKLIAEAKYELDFVLLKTHESRLTVEHAMTNAIASFADETFMKNYLLDIANHLDTQ